MKFLEKLTNRQRAEKPSAPAAAIAPPPGAAGKHTLTTTSKGAAAEAAAQRYLQQQGLALIASNYRTPGRGGGEIDLIMQAPDQTLVFVEVRQRSNRQFGGGAASINAAKRQRIILAAQHFLTMQPQYANRPCRFDALLLDGPDGTVQWIVGAFDASG